MQGLLTGSAGAAAGAITSNSGNIAVDVVNSTTSAMAQSRPKIDDPVALQAEQDQMVTRDKNKKKHIADKQKLEGYFNQQLTGITPVVPKQPESPVLKPIQ